MPTLPGYIAYIRVSTQRQGSLGVSLQEQKSAIEEYATRKGLTIERCVEERETAAKAGRPRFAEAVRLLRSGKAAGLILHKIDRGARNLEDWTALRRLAEDNIPVLFAQQDLDLRSARDVLPADMQAVMAAHYIRNLREETIKGLRGRLKQGIYPFNAPIGYLNNGGGKPKTLDPATAPLIREGFQLYDAGSHGLVALRAELERRGLRNRHGKPLSLSGVATLLRNLFYTGVIRIQRTGETYAGVHEPLISIALFDRVQARLDGRMNRKTIRHDFLFRRLLQCSGCHYSLIGERQKGHVYYRCHTASCPITAVRQETAETAVAALLGGLTFDDQIRGYLRGRAERLVVTWDKERRDSEAAVALNEQQLIDRTTRLTDALLDGVLDKASFDVRKEALLKDQAALRDQRARLATNEIPHRVTEYLELAGRASLLYESSEADIRRRMLEEMTSKRVVSGKKVEMTLAPPFSLIAEQLQLLSGGPHRGRPRTFSALVSDVVRFCSLDNGRNPKHEKVSELLGRFPKDSRRPLVPTSQERSPRSHVHRFRRKAA